MANDCNDPQQLSFLSIYNPTDPIGFLQFFGQVLRLQRWMLFRCWIDRIKTFCSILLICKDISPIRWIRLLLRLLGDDNHKRNHYKRFLPLGDVGGGGGKLPYVGYIGMCHPKGCGFQAVYSRTGYKIREFGSRIGYHFPGNWSIGWRFSSRLGP